MKPYAEDPDLPRQRRRHGWVIAAVFGFCLLYGVAFAFFAPSLILILILPILILGALVIWALPGVGVAPTRTLEGLFFTFFVTLVLWPNYLAIALPGLPWITVIRLTGIPLVLLFLVCMSVSDDFRGRLSQSLNGAPLIWKLLIAFVIIQLASIALSNQKADSIDKFIVAQMSWTTVFFVSAYVFLKPGRVGLWAALVWIMAVAVGVVAVLEYPHGHPLWAGHVPSFLRINDPVIANIMAGQSRDYTGVYRAQSTFSISLGLAEYEAIATPFVVHFMAQPFRWPIRAAAALTLPFLFFVVLLSGARLGVLGMLVSIMLYILIWGIQSWRRRNSGVVGPAVVLAYPAVGAAVLAATLFVGRLHRMVWGGGETDSSTAARVTQIHMGIPLIFKNPLGYGIGQSGRVLNFRLPSGFITIDSYYLMVVLEYGVIGFLIYYGIVALGIFYSLRSVYQQNTNSREFNFLQPAAISLAVFLVIKSVFSEQDNHPLIFMILGIITATISRAAKRT
jgi:hypothetical protein